MSGIVKIGEGARVRLVTDGFITDENSGSRASRESTRVLDASERDARLSISFYFGDRDPTKNLAVTVPAKHARRIKTDGIEGIAVPHAVRVESDAPVIVRHSQMDISRPAISPMTAIAYSVER